jgi:hypothetical protein
MIERKPSGRQPLRMKGSIAVPKKAIPRISHPQKAKLIATILPPSSFLDASHLFDTDTESTSNSSGSGLMKRSRETEGEIKEAMRLKDERKRMVHLSSEHRRREYLAVAFSRARDELTGSENFKGVVNEMTQMQLLDALIMHIKDLQDQFRDLQHRI